MLLIKKLICLGHLEVFNLTKNLRRKAMKKIYTALCAIAALTMSLSFTACEKKMTPPKPAEQPAKKQDYKSQPKPTTPQPAAPQPKQATGYNK